jgi:hypothetical protein
VSGLKAEQKSLEDIATPLTAEEADEEAGDETKVSGHESSRSGPAPTPAGTGAADEDPVMPTTGDAFGCMIRG